MSATCKRKTWLVSLSPKAKILIPFVGSSMAAATKHSQDFQDPCHTVLCMEPRLCGCSEMGDQIPWDKKCGAKLLSWMKDQVMLWRVAEITWATDHNFLGISLTSVLLTLRNLLSLTFGFLFFDSGGGIKWFLRYLISALPIPTCLWLSSPTGHLCRPQGSCHC